MEFDGSQDGIFNFVHPLFILSIRSFIPRAGNFFHSRVTFRQITSAPPGELEFIMFKVALIQPELGLRRIERKSSVEKIGFHFRNGSRLGVEIIRFIIHQKGSI